MKDYLAALVNLSMGKRFVSPYMMADTVHVLALLFDCILPTATHPTRACRRRSEKLKNAAIQIGDDRKPPKPIEHIDEIRKIIQDIPIIWMPDRWPEGVCAKLTAANPNCEEEDQLLTEKDRAHLRELAKNSLKSRACPKCGKKRRSGMPTTSAAAKDPSF